MLRRSKNPHETLKKPVFSHRTAHVDIYPPNCAKADRNKNFQYKKEKIHKTKEVKEKFYNLKFELRGEKSVFFLF